FVTLIFEKHFPNGNYAPLYCGSAEFITEPNQYDVLIFTENSFVVQSTESIEDAKIFCRACSAEVDILKSLKKVSMQKMPARRSNQS
ncbi:MAG: hypothetical protein RL329_4123, partial [Bacteroidota bacterium]